MRLATVYRLFMGVSLACMAGCISPPDLPNKQLLFIGLTRHWSNLDPDQSAALVKKYGAHGRSYELLELEPAGLGRDGMWKYLAGYEQDGKRVAGQIDKLIPYIKADRKAGLISKVYFWNTNVRKADCLTVDQFRQLIDMFGRKIGWQDVMCLFMNENDDNTPAATRSQVTAYGLSKLQSGYRISYEGKPKVAFAEYHPQRLGSSPGARTWSTVVAPDCGTTLQALYTGKIGGPDPQPNLAAWKAFIQSLWQQGKSIDCYNFDKELREEWVRTCCAAADLAENPPAAIRCIPPTSTVPQDRGGP